MTHKQFADASTTDVISDVTDMRNAILERGGRGQGVSRFRPQTAGPVDEPESLQVTYFCDVRSEELPNARTGSAPLTFVSDFRAMFQARMCPRTGISLSITRQGMLPH